MFDIRCGYPKCSWHQPCNVVWQSSETLLELFAVWFRHCAVHGISGNWTSEFERCRYDLDVADGHIEFFFPQFLASS